MFKLQVKITPFLWYDNQAGDAAVLWKMVEFDIAALQRAFDRR